MRLPDINTAWPVDWLHLQDYLVKKHHLLSLAQFEVFKKSAEEYDVFLFLDDVSLNENEHYLFVSVPEAKSDFYIFSLFSNKPNTCYEALTCLRHLWEGQKAAADFCQEPQTLLNSNKDLYYSSSTNLDEVRLKQLSINIRKWNNIKKTSKKKTIQKPSQTKTKKKISFQEKTVKEKTETSSKKKSSFHHAEKLKEAPPLTLEADKEKKLAQSEKKEKIDSSQKEDIKKNEFQKETVEENKKQTKEEAFFKKEKKEEKENKKKSATSLKKKQILFGTGEITAREISILNCSLLFEQKVAKKNAECKRSTDAWYNSDIVDSWFHMLSEQYSRVVSMSTNFTPWIFNYEFQRSPESWLSNFFEENGGRDTVAKKTVIFVPINATGNHWVLAAIYLQLKKICLFDPLERFARNKTIHEVCNVILTKLLQSEKAKEFAFRNMKIQKQQDTRNCGVFVCMWGEMIAQKAQAGKEAMPHPVSELVTFQKHILLSFQKHIVPTTRLVGG